MNKFQQHQKTKTAEQRYRDALEEELGSIKILGSPDIESVPVNLLDAFVSVDLSETWRSESRFQSEKMKQPGADEKHTNPENVLKRAFKNYRLLLLIGDPGSGKTTLMKYYAISCLHDQEYEKFGFKERVLPLYFPLRELEPKDAVPDSLPANLARWAKRHVLDISAKEFYNWLHERPTLVLLDGLDEISDLGQRKRVCEWIDNTCAGLKKARFVVTSRWTGYRKVDGIELGCDHMRADVRDFSREQQEDFLTKWFRAVFQRNFTGDGEPTKEWLARQAQRADEKVKTVIDFLKDEKNKSLRQLASVPMLLQIMAILWQERDILPQSRSELYNASLNYLLDFRDKRRNLLPVLDADKARRVLSPTALWMQHTLQKDEATKQEMHKQMQPILKTFDEQPDAEFFCNNLVNRAGLLAEYGETDYIFRHKSFREYLAGVQISKEDKKQEWLKRLVSYFGDDWWEEPLRFFISEADAEMFDSFMANLFQSRVSEELDQKQQNLLQTLVREAPQKKIDALSKKLRDTKTTGGQQRYILECLKTINTPEALAEVKLFADKNAGDAASLSFAQEITPESARAKFNVPPPKVFVSSPKPYRNHYEGQAEYIPIPGGEFRYSVSKEIEAVPLAYFAKYPVTNKRYRGFISYLENRASEATKILAFDRFAKKMLEFSNTIPDYQKYIGNDPKTWAKKLSSEEDANKRFNQDEQPVVGISWFAARAYCFWLSCLQAAQAGDPKLQDLDKFVEIYRLPTELEWEWAAAGREPDGSLREYPWPGNKGKEPNEKLANYDQHVDATTPVGRYPDGATPEGLMDMAGNVWEWMENWSSD
ncbi:SUMF1/EgtB/PvdO family nonheme iron enzyme, partial [candidate division KSB1 bacterium]|nr:SUMF1/EgtB/PvdO family nonheme iron enzyme [candidate division KSB1 bacterium]